MSKHLVCSKMWTDINVNVPIKELKNCCKREPQMLPPHALRDMGRHSFTKNQDLLADKKYFIENNDFPKTCSYCKHSHPSSIWQNWNEWKDRDWSEVALENLIDTDYTKNIEIMLSTTCNQTCMYCTEQVSSDWAKLKGIIPIIDNEWKTEVFKNLYEYIECNLTFDDRPLNYNFLGGEPFLELEIFDIIEKIISIHDKTQPNNFGHRYINFRFTSNLNIKRKTIERFIEVVKKNPKYKFSVTASLDALGKRGEEIRDGLNFSRFEENIRLLFAEKTIHRVDLMPTLTCLNIKYYWQVLEWFINLIKEYYGVEEYGHKSQIGSNFVTWPYELKVTICPPSYAEYLDKAADIMRTLPDSNFREEQINYLMNIKNHELSKERNIHKINDAIKFFQEQGELKNKNYWEIFPDLTEILNDKDLSYWEPEDRDC